jgi:hypothetical protein
VNRNTAVSAGVLFVLLATAGLLSRKPDRLFTPTSYGTAPFGYKAALDLMRESELPAGRNLERPRDLPERATVWWIEPTTLCDSGEDEQWSGAGWLERGGTAVVLLPASSGPPLCESIAGSALPPRLAPLVGAAPTPTPGTADLAAILGGGAEGTPRPVRGPRLRAPRNLTMPDIGAFAEAGDWTMAAEIDGRPFILERQVGEGRLVVVGDARFAANRWLDRADSAPLLMDLVGAYGAPLLDERDHGFGASGGTLSYLWGSPARPAFIGLALLGLTFAWWGAALSPRTAAGDERPAPTLEAYVGSLASLYARATDHAAVAVRYRDFALAQLRRQSALPPDTPAEILIDRLQRQRSIDASEARLLRASPAVASPAELRQHTQRLDEILRKAST